MGTSGGAVAPTPADGELVAFTTEAMRAGEAQAGDLVFVQAEETPLGAVISELDGCAFSHVGVLDVGDDGVPALLSARTGTPTARMLDLGGIRRDPLTALGHRGLFVAPLQPTIDREAGLGRLRCWEEHRPDEEPDSHSRFSYAKLLVVSAGLATVRRRRPLDADHAQELWEDVVAAAEALRWRDEVPGFYCAEAIAAAFALEFTTDALWVRDGEPHPVGVATPAPTAAAVDALEDMVVEELVVDLVDDDGPPPSRAKVLAELGEIRAGLEEALDEIGLTSDQVGSVIRLVVTLSRRDWRLAMRIVTAGLEVMGRDQDGDEPHRPEPLPGGRFVPPAFVHGVRTVLPTALVTPRMLLTDAVVTSVHPLRP